jgi:hypothetical protein
MREDVAFDNLTWPHLDTYIWPHLINKDAQTGSAKVLRLQPGWSAEEGAAFEPLPLHQQCRSYSASRYDAFFLCRTSRVLRKR